jgi:hypothetical protein
MAGDTAGGRWHVSYSMGPPLTVSRWRSDVRFPDPERPFKITVGVMFSALAGNGMPDMSAEGEFLAGVQNDLRADLPGYGAVLVLSVTGSGNREWVAYAPSGDWVQAWAAGFAGRWFQNRSCQISAAEDAGWVTYREFSGRRDVAMTWIYVLTRSEGGTWLPFYVGQAADVPARMEQLYRAGRLGPGTKLTVLDTPGGTPDDGPSAGAEQAVIDVFGRKNIGRGSLENEIDVLAKPGPHRVS